MHRLDMTKDWDKRPEGCRDGCQFAKCDPGCLFLHNEAYPFHVPPNTDGTFIVEVPFTKEELRTRHVRRNT